MNKVKIPHINMLAKFSRVDPDTNKYVKPTSPSLIYGTLTWVRSTIVLQSGGVLARGVTIATRYASVRRQFQDRDAPSGTSGENQVLNYTSKSWPCFCFTNHTLNLEATSILNFLLDFCALFQGNTLDMRKNTEAN